MWEWHPKDVFTNKYVKKGYGTMTNLEREIGKNNIQALELLGYIKHGISPKYGETGSFTKKGKDAEYFWSDRVSLWDRFCLFVLWLMGVRFHI